MDYIYLYASNSFLKGFAKKDCKDNEAPKDEEKLMKNVCHY